MHPLSTIELAEIRRAECLEYAEQYRLAQQAAIPAHGGKPWQRAVRDTLATMRVRMSVARPGLTTSTDLAPAAAETTETSERSRTMDQFQMAIAVMTACDVGVGPRDAEGRRREFTAEELDALAEFQLPGAGVVGRLAAVVAAMRSRASRRMGQRAAAEPAVAPSAGAAARA